MRSHSDRGGDPWDGDSRRGIPVPQWRRRSHGSQAGTAPGVTVGRHDTREGSTGHTVIQVSVTSTTRVDVTPPRRHPASPP